MRLSLTFAALLLTPGTVYAADFVGAAQCGTCHEKELADWKTSAHAHALARLSKRQAADAGCRGCHTTAPDKSDERFAGVQCESCHGAGSLYAPRYVMRDKKLAKLFGLQAVDEGTCSSCHAEDVPSVTPFVYEQAVKLVNHAKVRSNAPPGEVKAVER